MAKPVVTIVGRPNVGKSTLFNRLVGLRQAIVEDIPGVTRDRLYGEVEWNGRGFLVVDTGGLEEAKSGDEIAKGVQAQVGLALEESDLVLLMVDGKQGILPADVEVADKVRRADRRTILVVNKVDNFRNAAEAGEFYALGLGDPICISATHGLNINDLLDRVADLIPMEPVEETGDAIRIAVVGRPNVGKSSLVNRLLGSERVVVSDIPGTTRDAIDTYLERDGRAFVLVDTAGIRRKSRVEQGIERYGVLRSLRAIERADVALVLLDATAGVTEQDKKIAGLVHEAGKGSVLVINKWDLVVKDDKTLHRFEKEVRSELAFMSYTLTAFTSALSGQRVGQILGMVEMVAEQSSRRIATSQVNTVITEAVGMNPPPTDKGRKLKIYYVTQTGVRPPRFQVFVNNPDLMHFSYLRYIENQLREAFGFGGTPIRLYVRQRSR